MERIDVAIVGGGVVGLATAVSLGTRGHATCLLERQPRFGLEASTHNSGVIHAGIYYPAGSLKARLCVEGRDELYDFCRRHEVPHEQCGKLIVASDPTEITALEALATRGQQNGVADLEVIDRTELRQLEPHVHGAAAIWSPSTGIIEAEALVRTLTRLAGRHAYLLPATGVTTGAHGSDGFVVQTPRERLQARVVVNAAGLYADELSVALGGEALRIYPVRGEYAELVPSARHLVGRPVYPLPDASGHKLGVHLTRTTWGSVMLGPTARYQEHKGDYEGERMPVDRFYPSAHRLVPSLQPGDLRPGGTGIRARGAPANQTFADFIIRPDTRVPTLIHAAGIDSPGLTACLAIGKMVAGLVEDALV